VRGLIPVIAFAVLGVLVLGMAWYVNGHIGWCPEKGQCDTILATDLGALAALIALGIVGLLAILLAADGLFRLLRARGLRS